jgi:hypothetical protein
MVGPLFNFLHARAGTDPHGDWCFSLRLDRCLERRMSIINVSFGRGLTFTFVRCLLRQQVGDEHVSQNPL